MCVPIFRQNGWYKVSILSKKLKFDCTTCTDFNDSYLSCPYRPIVLGNCHLMYSIALERDLPCVSSAKKLCLNRTIFGSKAFCFPKLPKPKRTDERHCAKSAFKMLCNARMVLRKLCDTLLQNT